jgi:acyl-homoserine lactone acylase PvdQ
VDWAQRISADIQRVYIEVGETDQVTRTVQFAAQADEDQLLGPFAITLESLQSDFGTWQIPWGEINRFQRLTGEVVQKPDDNKSSLPVGFASATWGMLPSYNSRKFEGTHKRYGVSGNSFICAVEFGKKIKAKSLLAGGQSGDPASPHFWDQAEMYTKGLFKDVLFYREDVEKNIQKKYHPGQSN